MNTLHAVRRDRQGLRIAQSKVVMPLIGPLLDAWENVSNDIKYDMRVEDGGLQAVALYLDKINAAMEDAPAATESDCV